MEVSLAGLLTSLGSILSVGAHKTTLRRPQPPFFLFNCAGLYSEKPIADVTEEEYVLIMNVNAKGMYFICKYVVSELKKSGGGVIVNVSSDAGSNGNF